MKINECYADQDAKPMIEVSNNAFKITLRNLNHEEAHKETENPIDSVENERMKQVLALLKSKGSIARKDVDELLGVPQSTSGILLREMLDRGLLIKEGKSRSLVYKLKK